MDKEYLNFMKDAYNSGLCNEYRDEIRRCHEDKLSLVRLAMRQQSIPYIASKMREGVITKDYVKKAFSGFLNGFILKDCDGVKNYTYAWYVDYDYDNGITLDVDVAHVSFTSDVDVVVPKSKCTVLYVSNSSHCNIVLEGYNSPKVYIFDDSSVNIETADEYSTVVVYKYSEESVVSEGKFCLGNVRVFSKNLRL